jgi:hypothetical protein
MAVLEVDVEALFGDVDLAIGKPLIEVEVIDAEGGLGEGVPVHSLCLLPPVGHGVLDGVAEGSLVGDAKFGETANHGIK